MPTIRLRIWDVTASRSQDAEVPDDVAIDRLTAVLVERMGLPLHAPDGQVMVYKLHHKRTGRQLLDEQTLSEAGVFDGEELRVQPEITAGGRAVNA